MQQGEKTFVPADEPKKAIPNEESVRIRFCVFSDGTLNNRTNINQRLAAAPMEDLTDEELKSSLKVKGEMSADDIQQAIEVYNKHKPDTPDEESSYEGYYTNVEKMERYVDRATPPPDHTMMLGRRLRHPQQGG